MLQTNLALFVVLVSWALMFFIPRNRLTVLFLESYVGPLLIGALYLIQFVTGVLSTIGQAELSIVGIPGLMLYSTSAAGLSLLMMSYYLLFLGTSYWIYLDGQQQGHAHRLFLLITLIAAPVGLFAFGLARLLVRAREAQAKANALVAQ
jgi:hypothetical protein